MSAVQKPAEAAAEPVVSASAENAPTKSAGHQPIYFLPIFGLQYSRLQGLAGSLGVGVGHLGEPRSSWRGLVALVEPGAGGIKLQVGAGSVVGSEGAGGVSQYQNYAGAEVEGMLLGFNAMLGLYRHIGGLPTDPHWVGTAGVGLWY